MGFLSKLGVPSTLRAKLEKRSKAEANTHVSCVRDTIEEVFLLGAESLYALLQETTPDDERNASEWISKNGLIEYWQHRQYYIKAFVDARSGTVPKAHVEKLIQAERERCAKIIIEATRIPDNELRRGTGVRDHLVIFGERMADVILNPKESEVKS